MLNEIKLSIKVNKKLCILIACSFIIFFVSSLLYCSGDLGVTVAHGVYFWDALLGGNFRQLYTEYFNNPMTITAMYDLPLYVFFAIWNLPTYILYKLGIPFQVDIYVLTPFTYIWNKLLLCIVTAMVILYMCKIAKIINCYCDLENMFLYFISSFLFVYPVAIVGQYDIIPTLFILIGIYGYLTNKSWIFLGAFMIATGMKFYAFFAFVPLLLIKEKNFIKIFVKICACFGIPIICAFTFRSDLAYAYTKNFSAWKMTMLLDKTMPGNFSVIFIFIFALLILYIIAYCIRPTEQQILQLSVYVPFCVYGILFCFVNIAPYWLVMILPFISIMIFTKTKSKWEQVVSIVLSMGLEICSLVFVLYFHHDNLDYKLFTQGLFRNILNCNAQFSVYSLINNLKLEHFMPLFSTGFLACVIMLGVIQIKERKNDESQQKYSNNLISLIISSRNIVTLLFLIITFLCCYYSPKYEYMYTDMSYTGNVKELVDGYEVSSNSIVYGPYCTLYPGEHTIKIEGDNFHEGNVGLDVVSGQSYLDVYDVVIGTQEISYSLTVEEIMDNVEFRIWVGNDSIKLRKINIR